MAHAKTPAAAPSAAHAAPPPDPAPEAATTPGSPAAAVCAALTANPGATAAVIAGAAGTGRPAARDALTALEKAGTATRVKGGKPGIPDTWTLVGPVPPGADPNPGPEAEQDGQPGGTSEDETAGGTGQDSTAGSGDPAPDDDGSAEAGTSAAPDPEAEQPEPGSAPAAGGDHEDAVRGEQDDEAVPGSGGPQDPDDGGVPHQDDAGPADGDSDGDGEAGGTPDPALVTEITGRIGQIKAAADAAAIVVGSGHLRAALAGLDEIYEQAAQGRRELKAAIGGRMAPAARPGGLREKVLSHLDAHPGSEFTPHEIHKVLGHSSGAIANALDTLVGLGEAELATDKPRRFRRAARPDAAAPSTGGTASTETDNTDLAGAA